jgi:hypothetical protein
MMRRFRFVTSVLAALIAGVAWAGPQLEFEPKNLDFGKMKQGTELRKILTVRNVGDADLTITQVRASCTECLVDKIEKTTLPPGEQTELPVTYSATAAPGKQTANITFHSNDADEPLKRVYLAIEIVKPDAKPRIQTLPEQIELGIARLGKPVTVPVVIQNIGDGDLKLTEFVCGPGVILSAVPEKAISPEARFEAHAEINPAKPGVFRSHFSIVSDDPERRVVTLMVSGYVAEEKEIAALVRGLVVRPEWTDGPDGMKLTNLDFLNYSESDFVVWLPAEEARIIVPRGEMRFSPKIAVPPPSQQETSPMLSLSVSQPTATPKEK